jgi:hypothetical protein
MLRIDHQFLVGIGLGHLEEREQEIVQQRIYEIMELRVGHAIASSLTSAQQNEFERLIENDPVAAESFLERVIPNYEVVVRSELEFIAQAILHSLRQGKAVIPKAPADG